MGKYNSRKRKTKKNIPAGEVHIHSTFNNTIVTITDLEGNVVSWASAGTQGVKGSKKSTPFAAGMAAEAAGREATAAGMKTVNVKVKGLGSGREAAIRSLQTVGLEVKSITDETPIPHNGCRPPTRRRGYLGKGKFAMLKFEKPDYKVKEYIKDSHYGKFELEPLERGFGTTLGNALRRVMLSSLPGDAITSVKIDGVAHEFQKIDGVVEDVTAIVLNLKSIVIKNHAKDENKIIRLTKNTPGVVTAGDIEKDADIEILNPDQVIATLVEGGSLNMEMTIGSGRGYVVADDNKKLLQNDKTKIGAIAIDSLYSPVERINYEVETARVGQNNNFDKLILEVWTNGSISPEEALALAARILIEHFEILTSLNAIADETGLMISKSEDPSVKILETSIDDLDFSVRAYNCLKRANILTLKDLVDKSENEMMKIRNLGKKSLKEVMDKVKDMGLNFRDEN